MKRLRTRELQKLGHDPRQRLPLFEKRVDNLSRLGLGVPLQELGVSHDRREAVSELVGDPGHHLPHAREILFEKQPFA